MGDHAKFSPSNSKRWISCTASMLLPEPQQRGESEFAVRGTAIHAFSEEILLNGKAERKQEGYKLTDDDITGTVMPYVKYVEEVPGEDIWVEKKVKITKNCYGTADVIKYDRVTKTLHVIDLKAGQGVMVYITNNTQLQIYALGALKFLKDEMGYKVDNIKIHVVQPGLNNFESLMVEKENLLLLEKQIIKTIEDIKKKQVKYSPGDEECRWCPHKATCPALHEKSIEIARGDFAMLENTPVKEIDVNTLAKAMTYVPALKHFIKVVEEKSLQVLDQGNELPGFKLVRGRGTRKWSDEQKLIDAIGMSSTEVEILDEHIYTDRKVLSPAQMEKAFKNNNIDFDLSEYITKTEGNLKVAREDNPQKAVDKAEEAKVAFGNIN